MSRLNYKIVGLSKVEKAFKSLESEILSGQVDAVRTATLLIHETAVRSLQDNADGLPEIRYKPFRVVRVSPPGTPPNTDTGVAVKSIKVDFDKGGLSGYVGTNLKYLAALEFGTERMAPRPWLSTAVAAVAKDVAAIFAKAMRAAIKGVSK